MSGKIFFKNEAKMISRIQSSVRIHSLFLGEHGPFRTYLNILYIGIDSLFVLIAGP